MLTRPRLRSGNASIIKTTGSFLGTVIMRSHRSHVFWALFPYSRIGCVTHSPGPQKGALASAEGGLADSLILIPHTFDKINTVLFLWLMIWVLGHRSEGTDTGLGSFRPFRAAEANTAIFYTARRVRRRAVIINC